MGIFEGYCFCVTGTFSRKRAALNKVLVDNGATVASSVTNKVTHLLCEGDEGSAKHKKAVSKGLPIVDEAWLEAKLLGEEEEEEAPKKKGAKAKKAPAKGTKRKKKEPEEEEEEEEKEEEEEEEALEDGGSSIEEMVFCVVGDDFSVSVGELKDMLKAAGATVHGAVSNKVTHVISGGGEGTPKYLAAVAKDLPIHDEDWAMALLKGDSTKAPPKKKVAAKKTTVKKTVVKTAKKAKKEPVVEEEEDEEEEEEEEEKTTSAPKKEKSESKKASGPRGAKPDSRIPGASSYTVHGEYHVKLNQTNIAGNNNKYYIIQLLETPSGGYMLWTRWGRVGEGGQTQSVTFSAEEQGIKAFQKKFQDKTKNAWANRGSFVKHAGKYQLVETEEDDGDDSVPLGKLSKPQIEKGQAVLEKIEAALTSGASNSVLTNLSSEFFSLVPTDFGRKIPEPIRTMEKLREKQEQLKFFLRMGFEPVEEEESPSLTPIDGVMDLPLPASLMAAAKALCAAAEIHSSDKKGDELAKKQAGKPVKPMDKKLYASLMLYTSNAIYAALNKVLREENRTGVKKYFNYLRLFLEAFDHLPAKSVRLWRGISVDLHDAYPVGSTITWWGVSSCTADEKVARNFMSGCGGSTTLFTIDTKTACDISSISFFANEKESLLAPGTQLKVKSSKRKGKITEIHLEEVGRCVG